MLAGICDITVVTTSEAAGQFIKLLGDGRQWGLSLAFRVQDQPRGIADGLLSIGGDNLRDRKIALILGDNIFFGAGLSNMLVTAMSNNPGATVFGYDVADPSTFGIVSLDADGRPFDIIEKPTTIGSRTAVTGLYFYQPDVLDVLSRLSPSDRGELEITDVNRCYLEQAMSRILLKVAERSLPSMLLRDFQLFVKIPVMQLI